jgi:hypothetical protein
VTCDLQTGYLVGLDLSINSIASGISGSSSLFSLTGDEWQLWEEEEEKAMYLYQSHKQSQLLVDTCGECSNITRKYFLFKNILKKLFLISTHQNI